MMVGRLREGSTSLDRPLVRSKAAPLCAQALRTFYADHSKSHWQNLLRVASLEGDEADVA